MSSDSIANATCGKKKRTNRLAKLKQSKLDARREQWLSQAKNKENKKETSAVQAFPMKAERNRRIESGKMENQEIGTRVEENEGLSYHDSDLESLVNSSVTTGSRKDRPGSSSGSSTVSGGCSEIFSEEEEDDGCLDDWEAVADALTAEDKKCDKNSEELPPVKKESDGILELPKKDTVVLQSKNMVPQISLNNCAWRSDDAFRPQSLPNLSKHRSFPTTREQQPHQRHFVRGGTDAWVCSRNCVISTIPQPPSSCPICYEDLDITDSSFMPCICGFRLCLFCHNKIFEVGDSRCPGCRRPYDPIESGAGINGGFQPVVNSGSQMYRMSRSCSMSQRTLAKACH